MSNQRNMISTSVSQKAPPWKQRLGRGELQQWWQLWKCPPNVQMNCSCVVDVRQFKFLSRNALRRRPDFKTKWFCAKYISCSLFVCSFDMCDSEKPSQIANLGHPKNARTCCQLVYRLPLGTFFNAFTSVWLGAENARANTVTCVENAG